jgi:hypothetical protein
MSLSLESELSLTKVNIAPESDVEIEGVTQ